MFNCSKIDRIRPKRLGSCNSSITKFGTLAILAFFTHLSTLGQSSAFSRVLDSFITEKYNPYSTIDDYMVFIVEIKGFDTKTKDFCFKISYIFNSYNLNEYPVEKGYYRKLENQLVWLSLDENEVELSEILGFNPVTESFLEEVNLKLLNSRSRFILSHGNSYIGCLQNGRAIGKTFYEGEPIPPSFLFER